MSTEKLFSYNNAGTALAIGLIISSLILGWSYKNSKKGDEAITVTGSAKKRITSDLVLWSAGVSSQAPQLADAYKQLSNDIPKIKQYLLSKGIPEDQMTVSSISTTTIKRKDTEGGETGVPDAGRNWKSERTHREEEGRGYLHRGRSRNEVSGPPMAQPWPSHSNR